MYRPECFYKKRYCDPINHNLSRVHFRRPLSRVSYVKAFFFFFSQLSFQRESVSWSDRRTNYAKLRRKTIGPKNVERSKLDIARAHARTHARFAVPGSGLQLLISEDVRTNYVRHYAADSRSRSWNRFGGRARARERVRVSQPFRYIPVNLKAVSVDSV